MKRKRLRAQAPMVSMITVAIMALGLSAAFPAGAQDLQPTLVELAEPVKVNGIMCRYQLVGPLPTSSTEGKFTPWSRMHPHTFDGKLEAYIKQCESTVGVLPWLTKAVCKDFEAALQQGNCAVVPKVNYFNMDVLRGKRDGRSTAYQNQHMQLEEGRQAIFVNLPGHRWLGMFAGEQGQSCNNFFALEDIPPPPPAVVEPPPPPPKAEVVVEPPPPPPPQGQWVCVNVPAGQVVHSPVGQHLDGFVLRDKCCCGNDTVVPSFNFNLGDTVEAGSGYSERCFWIQPNQTSGETQ